MTLKNELLHAWTAAWPSGADSVADPLLQRPQALAERAFKTLARATTDQKSTLLRSIDPTEFARDCALMAAPLRQNAAGNVKILYFTTKGTQLDRILLSLVFTTILARLNRYGGPIAWISFPTSLLGPPAMKQVAEAFATITRIDTELSAPIDVAFESNGAITDSDAAEPPSIYVGYSYPFRRKAPGEPRSDFESRHGLPLICIPSRTTEGVVVRVGPSPLARPSA